MPESNIQTNSLPETPNDPEPEPLSIDVSIQTDAEVSEVEIQKIVRQILTDHQWIRGEISIAVVDDPTIHRLNQQYLEHDYETDVLSFVLDQDDDQKLLNGEVIVSSDTALRIAQEEGVSAKDELLLYIIHGTLHLAGFDDKDPDRRKLMREAEAKYTQQFGMQYSSPNQDEAEEE